jgi:hypothetical protein
MQSKNQGIFPNYLPEMVIGIGVHIIAATIYERLNPKISILIVIVVAAATIQMLLIRHAYFRANRDAAQRVADNRSQIRKEFEATLDSARKLNAELQDSLDKLCSKYSKERAKRAEILHKMIHQARDLGVKLLGQTKREKLLSPLALDPYKSQLSDILSLIADFFGALAAKDGASVWVALRRLQSDGQFHTYLRTPNCNAHRGECSEPLPRESVIVETLVKSYKRGDCALLTGPGRPEWYQTKNDIFEENKSVLLGAVFSKVWQKDRFDHPVLTWILCVNATEEGAFTEDHKPIMRCCNDILSWLVNEFARVH